MDRRKFIKTASIATAAMSYSPVVGAKEKLIPLLTGVTGEIDLNATKMSVQMLSGDPTDMLCFDGSVVSGKNGLLRSSPGYLGPTIEARTGDKLNINFKNQTGEDSIVHWHGLHLPEDQDGHPSYAIKNGQTYKYSFEVENRAGLYWYHPHPHGRTGYQVYHGLAGLFVVRDEEEDALNLPSGENELFITFQDRHFGEDNQLIYIQSGHDIMMGKIGNRLVVNGSFPTTHKVKKEAYRLRLLNGGNALTYRLQWSDGSPIHLIGTDGGLLEKRVELESILFAPGERLDVLVDLSSKQIDDDVELLSIPIVDNGNSQPFAIYQFNVGSEGKKQFSFPNKLSSVESILPSEAVNENDPKVFSLIPKQGIGWTIDGLPYEMDGARPKETVKLGTTEIWEFDLTNAGMIHPMHVHGSQFQVLERINGPYSDGLVYDGGWKDTVAVLPGDKVRIIKRFNDHMGKFLFHCHLLEHEDNSMMRNFVVEK
jgi:FtsP/CotA-like multicopper oxidase with cupredoxin domain